MSYLLKRKRPIVLVQGKRYSPCHKNDNLWNYTPNVTPGGNALKFYALLRLEAMTAKPSANLPYALGMRIKVIKTKVFPPQGYGKDPVQLDLVYGRGFNMIHDVITTCKRLGVIRFAGPTCKVRWELEGDEEKLCSGGRAGLAEILEDEDILTRLIEACYTICKINNPDLEEETKETTETT